MKVRRWITLGVAALCDQALAAGSTLLIGVLLARHLEPTAYGAFATAMSVFLLLGAVYTGIWVDPMLVYGTGLFRAHVRGYLRILEQAHWRFGLAAAILLVSAGMFCAVFQPELGRALSGVGVAAPLLLLLWLARRETYVLGDPRLAAFGSALYLGLCVIGLSLLIQCGELSPVAALMTMGGASLAAGSWIMHLAHGRASATGVQPPMAQVISLHRKYGRWALTAAAWGWVPMNLPYLVLPVLNDLEAGASLRATLTLILPVLHVNTAMTGILVPQFVHAAEEGRLLQRVHATLFALGVGAVLYWGVLLGIGEMLMDWIYDGRYDASLLGWAGVLPLPATVLTMCGSAIKAMDCPRLLVGVYVRGAVLSGVVEIVGISWAGARGAVIGIVAVHVCMAALMYQCLVREQRNAHALLENA